MGLFDIFKRKELDEEDFDLEDDDEEIEEIEKDEDEEEIIAIGKETIRGTSINVPFVKTECKITTERIEIKQRMGSKTPDYIEFDQINDIKPYGRNINRKLGYR